MAVNLRQLTRRQRAEILAADEANLTRLANSYILINNRLQGNVDALVQTIENADEPSRAAIQQTPQFKRLIRQMQSELDDFTTFTATTLETAAFAAIGIGLAHSQQWIRLASSGFTGVDSQAMVKLLDYLRRDGPLYNRLAYLTGATVDKVTAQILEGVGLGYNPRKIAGLIQDAFGGGLTDALRNTRTVQLYAYRDAARANYMASDGIVDGWIWYAELDADTCPSCIAQHGSIHDLDESLDDHYNGRCAAIPHIPGLTEDVQSGQEWFDGLDTQSQIEILGDSKHAALQAGQFTFDQLSKQVPNDVYGTMRISPSLAELIGE